MHWRISHCTHIYVSGLMWIAWIAQISKGTDTRYEMEYKNVMQENQCKVGAK